jgi:hypothetical protein
VLNTFFIIALLVEEFEKIWRAKSLFFTFRQHTWALNSADPDSGNGLVHWLRLDSRATAKMMDKSADDVHAIEGDRHQAGLKVFSLPGCLVQ